MSEVVWTGTALADLRRIRDFIEQSNPGAAASVALSLRDAGNSLVDFARRGRRVPGTDMRELVARLPYVIRYRPVGDIVVILRVRHTSRQPTTP